MLPQRLWALLFDFFYYLVEGFEHLKRQPHYAAVLAPALDVESFIVVVDEYLGDEPLIVVKPLGPLRDGLIVYLTRLLANLNVPLRSPTVMLIQAILHTSSSGLFTCPYSPTCREGASLLKKSL